MTANVHTSDRPNPTVPDIPFSRKAARRAALLMLIPVVVYALVRPYVSSDTLALGIASAIPILYSLGLAIFRHEFDPIALVSGIGFAVACVVAVLTGGNSLPLKLDEAFITFAVGIVLLVAVVIRRPFPLGRLLRIPDADSRVNSALGAMIGAFLVLHAVLHFVLAVSLSTGSYLVLSRVVNWGTLVVGGLLLSLYVRRLRERARRDA
jgi:hypothetical protein